MASPIAKIVWLRSAWERGAAVISAFGAVAACSSPTPATDDPIAPPPPVVDAGVAPPVVVTDAGPQQSRAQKLFTEIEPELTKNCGGGCHQTGATQNAPPWLKAPAYETITHHPGIVIRDVYSSKLLTKTNHLGVSLQDKSLSALRDKVVNWLTAEAAALDEKALPATPPFPVVNGANGVDLSAAGTNVMGARLTFTAAIHTVTGSPDQILQLTDVKLQAPAAITVHVVHPVFIIVPAGDDATPQPDPTDQFSTVDQTIAAGTIADLGPGAAMLVKFPTNAQLKVQFAMLESPKPVETTTTPCKDVTGFTNNAVPALQSNGCTSCHGGADPTAVGAVNMTKLGTDNAAACQQVRSKVNAADKPHSAIILAPTSGNALTHNGGKTLDPSSPYVTSMMTWMNNE